MIRYKVMGSMAGSAIGGKNIQLDKSRRLSENSGRSEGKSF